MEFDEIEADVQDVGRNAMQPDEVPESNSFSDEHPHIDPQHVDEVGSIGGSNTEPILVECVRSMQCGTGRRLDCGNPATCPFWHTGEKVGEPISKYAKRYFPTLHCCKICKREFKTANGLKNITPDSIKNELKLMP